MDEVKVKLQRVRDYMKEKGLKGVLLTKQANFSWITCGGDNFVVMGSDAGVASVLVTENRNYVITTNIEAGRIKNEEVEKHGCCSLKESPQEFRILSHMWWEDAKKVEIIKKVLPLNKLASDTPLPGAKSLGGDFSGLRYSLTPEEISRYEWLGGECGKSMGRVCKAVKLGDSEHEIAGRLGEDLLAKGIVPTVLLIAADDRISKYRHPIPTDKVVKKYVMVVLCGRKWGLITSLTRLVHFGKLSAELRRKHDAVTRVDTCFVAATRPGVRVSDIFKCAVETYKDTGFADEWKLHHQGGATGYEGRDYRGMSGSKEIVRENQAFAWNPSITGTKSEDTVIAYPDQTKVISAVPGWPMVETGCGCGCCGVSLKRPDILIK